ncbi:MAG: formate dehydrogenase accessory sulfurtransferase FdhD [Bacteroidia bacterium]
MTKPSVSSVNITRINANQPEQTLDLLTVEEPMEIRLGFGPADLREQKSVSVTMRTPGNDFELALGFLFTEGIIQNPQDIYKIHYCTELNTKENLENIVRVELKPELEIDLSNLQRNFYTTSSCGVCGKESIEAIKTNCPVQHLDVSVHINPQTITQLPDKLRAQQSVFEHTGGIHACALFDTEGNLLLLREDVGRHNALDKLIGAALNLPAIQPNKTVLLLSGRASFELLQKAAMAGIPIVCAVGAPSSLAVQTAQSFNITLVGFLRNQRFNIYSTPERITY